MPVYVDNMKAPYRKMLMCHMMADTTEELLVMADKIGVDRRYLQRAKTPHEHIDICQSKKALAIKLGAIPITQRGSVQIVRAKRSGTAMPRFVAKAPGVPAQPVLSLQASLDLQSTIST